MLIPGGKHVILDTSTPMLAELIIYGILEIANDGEPKQLKASRILVDRGGRLFAGTAESPLESDLQIHLSRGGLSELGSGDLEGNGLFAVGAAHVQLIGSRNGLGIMYLRYGTFIFRMLAATHW